MAEKGTGEKSEKKGGDRDKNGRGVWDEKEIGRRVLSRDSKEMRVVTFFS